MRLSNSYFNKSHEVFLNMLSNQVTHSWNRGKLRNDYLNDALFDSGGSEQDQSKA